MIVWVLLCLYAIVVVVRLVIRIFRCHWAECVPGWLASYPKSQPVKTLVVMGSGGHTTEMIYILDHFDVEKYQITLVLGDTDSTSMQKLQASWEKNHKGTNITGVFSTEVVPRAREVGQSYFTSVFSTLYALLYSLVIVYQCKPQLVLANGPGTCIPICFAAILLECLLGRVVAVVFVESFCRVQTLSLSGKLLKPVADRFVVQWPELQQAQASSIFGKNIKCLPAEL
eukprot:Platyproteum_vivax@DN14579_c0_g1_i1.p1